MSLLLSLLQSIRTTLDNLITFLRHLLMIFDMSSQPKTLEITKRMVEITQEDCYGGLYCREL